MTAGLFWLFSYAVHSARAGLVPGGDFELLMPRRAFAITVGTAFFVVAAKDVLRTFTEGRPVLVRALRWSAAGAVIMLFTLTAYAYATSDSTESMIWSAAPSNSVWVLLWLGYFTAWLLATVMWALPAASGRNDRDASAGAYGPNVDTATVRNFSQEWARFDQSKLSADEHQFMFDRYFALLPVNSLRNLEGFDLGCGSGRWAKLLAPAAGKLHCIDPAAHALEATRRNLAGHSNVQFHQAYAETMPFSDASQDFGYSLGVLHHVPDPRRAMRSCVQKLKPGAPFLIYVYYNFENRPVWFKSIWRSADWARKLISRLPLILRLVAADLIAAAVYYPAARTSLIAEKLGVRVSNFPLSEYRFHSLYTMRTDALDRFGTRIEHRFSRAQVQEMMTEAGLENIRFSRNAPFWVACGTRRHSGECPLSTQSRH